MLGVCDMLLERVTLGVPLALGVRETEDVVD